MAEENDQQNDIKFASDDPYCSKNQAIIQHKAGGYYLLETAINGLCRIKVTEDVQLEKGMCLSFGLHVICRIIDVYDAQGQTTVTRSDGSSYNLY